MTCYENTTQDIYDAHKAETGACFHLDKGRIVVASGSASVRASGSASVEASGSASVEASGSASVEAYGSASVEAYGSASVEAYGSASVRAYGSASVEAYGSASVEAYGSASVEAYDSASVRAYDSASVEATPAVPVQQYPGYHGTTTGGVTITIPDLTQATPPEWAAYYGIKPAQGGHVIVYKAVDNRLVSGHGMAYPVGETVTAPDWKPVRDCGYGLHFGPTPRLARTYHRTATRFLACQVKTADMVPLGDKVKAPSCTVLYETDIRGQRITARTTPDMITELAAGEVIVVGTNKDGVHAGGAAKQAAASFGLADGTGEGPSGSTYALPTMEGPEALAAAAGRFLGHARQNPETTFLLTKVGCGIAGYAEADVAPLFAGAPVNVVLPAGWAAVPAAS